ncbi:class II aldolase/adducin family protein [Silvibacterium sp.]|uniref:class II aldolase/adducin family protein n=1 Tax=Silvibacterium sp. TaxID=1964179 RepID=UPI0039E6F571
MEDRSEATVGAALPGSLFPAEHVARHETAQRREIVRYGRWLSRLGYAPGTSGNLSVRLPNGNILVSPTGVSKALLRPSDMVTVDLEGRQLAGARKATSELGMHLAVYRLRDDVSAVVHAHPPLATAFACTGRALDEMLCQEAAMALGPVPLAVYATTGTAEVAASLEPLIPGHQAILMANHGAVSYGSSVADAFYKMETVEHLAQIRLAVHQLGTPQPLTQRQLEQLVFARHRYLQNAG